MTAVVTMLLAEGVCVQSPDIHSRDRALYQSPLSEALLAQLARMWIVLDVTMGS